MHKNSEKKKLFKMQSSFRPAGDQIEAIKSLKEGILNNVKEQVLLGVTGSGKTYTMANVINDLQKPAIILAHNKTLAAQLYSEMKSFFPENAVEYFVSYYDYYQPEAYVARSDTYIEKTANINEEIDRMRHSATRSLLERRDSIVVASVSCIYGIGGVSTYSEMVITINVGMQIDREELQKKLTEIQYKRNDVDFSRGKYRVKGDVLEIFPAHYEDMAWRISFFGDEIEAIYEVDGLTGEKIQSLEKVTIYANSHYVTPGPTMQQAMKTIKGDLKIRLKELEDEGRLVEYQRLNERTKYDLEMIMATGTCSGIENYSRYLSGRNPGEAPPTLFEYLPNDALLFVDESHVSVPQIRGMYNGDQARKGNLVNFGFRLPSAKDNRPLKFEEWDSLRPKTIFVSATPGPWEMEKTHGVFVEQVIRPTGLLDPVCEIRPCENQIDDLMEEIHVVIKKGLRVLVTTLTKKMSEALTDYLCENGLKVKYMHSDIKTLERIEIIKELRRGDCDVLIGINLLREGLDIPECGLVAILDADKEGFLRSRSSLIQTIGRSARNSEGRVILYADKMTNSLKEALDETSRRRKKQEEYNEKNGITPKTIQKKVEELIEREKSAELHSDISKKVFKTKGEKDKYIQLINKKMFEAAANLNFEEAAKFRDELNYLEKQK